MSKSIFLRYITQNIVGMLGLSCYILVDTLFISIALGTSGLAALNLAITVFSIVSGTGQLLGVGGGTDFAICRAKGRDASHSLSTALIIGGLFALLFAAAGIFFSSPLTQILGADKTTFALTQTYVRMTLLFSPVYMLNAILQGFVRNDGSPNLAMLSMLVSSGMNIILDYVFMFPFSMGMFGAVLATGLSACLSTPVLLLHFAAKHCTLLPLRRPYALRSAMHMLSLGLSALIGELASAVSLLTFNLLLMSLSGPVGVAAYGIIANTALVSTAIFTGMGQGIQPLASQQFGLHNRPALRILLSYIRNTVLGLSLMIFAVVFLLAQPITGIFNHDHSVHLQTIAEQGLRLYFAGFLFAGINITACAFLSAVNRPRHALVISVLRSCLLLIPAAIVLSALLHTSGVWLAFTLTEAVCCIISLISMKTSI